jgi:hypothetical protein
VESDQQGGDLRVGAAAGKNFRHDRARLLASQRLAVVGDAVESVSDQEQFSVLGSQFPEMPVPSCALA